MKKLLLLVWWILLIISMGAFALMCFAIDDLYHLLRSWWRGIAGLAYTNPRNFL